MDLKICLDTNIFIAVINKESDSIYCEMIFNAIEKNRIESALSTIVIAEILVGFNQNADNEGKQKFLDKVRLKYQVFPVTLEIAEQGAEIRASTNLRLPDALIFATMIQTHADVLISNDHPLAKKEKKRIMSPKEFVITYTKIFE
jgi:predicted nucleic acid-binding protein